MKSTESIVLTASVVYLMLAAYPLGVYLHGQKVQQRTASNDAYASCEQIAIHANGVARLGVMEACLRQRDLAYKERSDAAFCAGVKERGVAPEVLKPEYARKCFG